MSLFLTIKGMVEKVEVATVSLAVQAYTTLRGDKTQQDCPDGRVEDEAGNLIGFVGYNGRWIEHQQPHEEFKAREDVK